MEMFNDAEIPLANTTLSTYKVHTVSIAPNVTTYNVALVTCFLCIVIFITVFGNCFAITAVRMSRELRHITYYFIINLCISDLFVVLLSIPFWISYLLTGWPNNKSGSIYIAWISLDIFYGTWSIMSQTAISIERYLSIVYPLRYKTIVTKKRAWIALAFVLAYSSLTSSLGYVQVSTNESKVSAGIFVLAYVIPVVIQVLTHRKIFSEARRQRKFIVQEENDRKRIREQCYPKTTDLNTVQTTSGSRRKLSQESRSYCNPSYQIVLLYYIALDFSER